MVGYYVYGQVCEVVKLGFGFGVVMGFDYVGDYVCVLCDQCLGGFQYGEGFVDIG